MVMMFFRTKMWDGGHRLNNMADLIKWLLDKLNCCWSHILTNASPPTPTPSTVPSFKNRAPSYNFVKWAYTLLMITATVSSSLGPFPRRSGLCSRSLVLFGLCLLNFWTYALSGISDIMNGERDKMFAQGKNCTDGLNQAVNVYRFHIKETSRGERVQEP